MPWTSVCLNKKDIACFAKQRVRTLSYVEAILEAQQIILEQDPEAFLIGEGINDAGGVFGSTKGLSDTFDQRVMDMPIAENGLTGVVIAAAAAGMHPLLIHMRSDFLPMSMDQLVNHAGKWHSMSGGQVSIPLVVRSIIGRGWGSAAQHSQGLHSLFLSVPGLKIVLPSTPYDAKALLLAAWQDPNPVLVFEHRWLYDNIGPVPEGTCFLPIGKGVVRNSGTDVTVIAVSHMLPMAMEAAQALKQDGVSVEVLDPRSIAPLDMELIAESVEKTRHLVICDVACKTAGYGAEVVTRLMEHNPGTLQGPVKRISFPDLPTPSSPALEEAYYPGTPNIITAIKETLSHQIVHT